MPASKTVDDHLDLDASRDRLIRQPFTRFVEPADQAL